MLEHKFFHRAQKVIVKADDKKKSKKGKADADAESAAEEVKKKAEKRSAKNGESADSSDPEGKGKEAKKKKKEKPTKKVKLDMHLVQTFVDGKEPFVWIYDPVPLKAWLIGFGLVVGAVLLCLFPLWPRVVRTYVYYLSVAAAGFLFFIIGLAVLRFIVFVLIWCLTLGRHHFWMLPNLTEDVGFFASFWPLYLHEYKGPADEKSSSDSNTQHTVHKVAVEEAASPSKEQESDSQKSSDVEEKGKNENGENGFEILDSQEIPVEDS
jgi:translocation protein SEC62